MRVKFLLPEKSGFGEFKPGDELDLHEPEAMRLIAQKIAEVSVVPLAEMQVEDLNSKAEVREPRHMGSNDTTVG